MKSIFSFMFLPLCTTIYAQKDSIGASQTKQHVGATTKVCDVISEARLDNISKKEATVLYTGSDYKHRTFALVFPQSTLKRFSYNPNEKMINHSFCATGKIVMYDGKPAMYIKDESQLNIAE